MSTETLHHTVLLDEAIDAELQDFIGRRKASMPDASY